MKYSEKKMNSLKQGEGVPLLNFEGGPGVPLLNFEGGPGVPLLNFRGVPGLTFKLWGGAGFQGPEVLVPLLHHAAFTYVVINNDLYVVINNDLWYVVMLW